VKARALGVVAATALVAAYLLWRAYDLVATGSRRGLLLGIGVVLLVLVGGLLVAGEVRLAAASERLGRRLFGEGFVEQDLPVTAAGRVDREAADALFARRKAEVDQAQEDWRAWFRLASAYDLAGDSPRARRAMRRAVALERADRRTG
jgi:hypothetical protein